mmetsp:Transcript_6426/g.26039  ORF Transcript_6426/g.26039 Transcript_6426/m.26039 type:complete len:250 (-) Transcript_6426:180-929(-)
MTMSTASRIGDWRTSRTAAAAAAARCIPGLVCRAQVPSSTDQPHCLQPSTTSWWSSTSARDPRRKRRRCPLQHPRRRRARSGLTRAFPQLHSRSTSGSLAGCWRSSRRSTRPPPLASRSGAARMPTGTPSALSARASSPHGRSSQAWMSSRVVVWRRGWSDWSSAALLLRLLMRWQRTAGTRRVSVWRRGLSPAQSCATCSGRGRRTQQWAEGRTEAQAAREGKRPSARALRGPPALWQGGALADGGLR